jgi:TonB family protein
VLLIFLGGAWRLNWLRLPWLGSYSAHKANSQKMVPGNAGKVPSGVTHAAAPPAVAAASNPNSAEKTVGAEPPAHTAEGAAETPSATEKAEAPAKPKAAKTVAPATTTTRGNAKGSDVAAVSRHKSAPSETPAAIAQPVPPEPAASDATIIPPKLLKSVAPVYPPEAMENYITGDVRVDAVVEPNGKIGAMKILTGPAPLRQAAMDALKQYEYAPATQGGKAVAAHVTATVKFWFNP